MEGFITPSGLQHILPAIDITDLPGSVTVYARLLVYSANDGRNACLFQCSRASTW